MNPIRRKDREMSIDFAYGVIDKSQFGTLATTDKDGNPYCIPVSAVRKDDTIYFHCAKIGTKIDNIKNNPNVCMSFVGDVHVPVEFNVSSVSEGNGRVSDTRFTTEYESAVVFGTAAEVEDDDEKLLALRLIGWKYTPDDMPFFDAYVNSSIKITDVVRVNINHITGKRKKFDKSGIEMKFGRME